MNDSLDYMVFPPPTSLLAICLNGDSEVEHVIRIGKTKNVLLLLR